MNEESERKTVGVLDTTHVTFLSMTIRHVQHDSLTEM